MQNIGFAGLFLFLFYWDSLIPDVSQMNEMLFEGSTAQRTPTTCDESAGVEKKKAMKC